ncbi:MAG: hypothetical protein HEQ35_16690 [Gloeotrichia echinulata IR180]
MHLALAMKNRGYTNQVLGEWDSCRKQLRAIASDMFAAFIGKIAEN